MTQKSLKFPFNFDVRRLQEDASRFSPADWIPHFNIHNYVGDWSGIALRAVKGANVSLYPDPHSKEGFIETEAMNRCSYVPEVLKDFQCELSTVRFLKLAAGSIIRRHRDYELGFEDGEIRIHVPVFTNPQVEFILDDQRIDMKNGEAWYLNVNFHHSVKNESETDRIHLVIDCKVNDWITSFFPLSTQTED